MVEVTLRIEHLSGDMIRESAEDLQGTSVNPEVALGEISRLDVHSSTVERSFDEQDHAEIEVYRDEFDEIQGDKFVPQHDELYLELDGTDIFGGRLVDITRGGTTIELIVGDWETDLRQGRPTPGTHTYVNASDQTIVNDALNRSETVSAGRIQSVHSGVGILFSHTSPAKMLHTLREATGAEFRLNPNKTLDYVERLGKDNAELVGPRNQTITNEFSLEEKVQDSPTHLRVLGAGEGDYQLQVEIVSNHFDGEGFGREVWHTIINKEATTKEHLRDLGENYMAEYDGSPEHIEVAADIHGLDVSLGDTFPVVYEEEHIDTRLRVIELAQHIDETGIHYETTLSNRLFTRGDPNQEARQDINRYNLAFEGTAVPFSDAGGRQPVNKQNNYEMDIDYPADVVQELDAKLKIDGMAYRAYSRGAAGGGGTIVSETAASNDDFKSVVEQSREQYRFDDVRDDWRTVAQHKVTKNTSILNVDFTFIQSPHGRYIGHKTYTLDDRVTGGRPYRARLYNKTRGTYHPNYGGNYIYAYPDDSASATFFDAKNLNGDTLEMELMYDGTMGAFPIITTYTMWYAAGQHNHEVEFTVDPHKHDPDPGIVEYDYYPSNCQVTVNGQQVDHAPVGDGEGGFEEVIDIRSYLTPGFNSIEISSDTLGHIRATASLDLYRQITGRES